MQQLDYSQTWCAEALGLSRQAVNNWACGWNVPARYRSALASLVTLAIHRALEPDTPLAPADVAARTALIDRYVAQWFFENHDARGVSEARYSDLSNTLALSFKTPLRAAGVEAWKHALVLHLQAAHVLRRLIQRHEMEPPPAAPVPFRPEHESPAGWFWSLAEQLAGARLQKSAELTQWEDRVFQQWSERLPAEHRAGLETMRRVGTRTRRRG